MGRRLVSVDDVRQAAGREASIEIVPSTIVTPAARDLAASLGVPLTLAPDQEAVTPDSGHPIVALGADHGGVGMKEDLLDTIRALGFEPLDCGTHGPDAVDYPTFAARVAEMVVAGPARFGIMIDGAGIGSAMVANKIPGVRAARCHDVTTAHHAREHNNANVLTLGGALLGPRLAIEIVTTFLQTPFGGGRHARRVALIDALDRPG